MAKKVLSLASPPEVLQLMVGDVCQVKAIFDYVGPEIIGAVLYAAIGIRGIAFDEKVKGSKAYSVPATAQKTSYTASVDIPITSAISVGTAYDMYAKLTNIPGADLYDYLNDIIEIVQSTKLSIRLKNAPAGATRWAIIIYSNNLAASVSSPLMSPGGIFMIDTLSLFWFPAYVSAVVSNAEYWEVTSKPDLDWVTFYNPNCVIPGFGDYYLNCATGLFEKL